MATGFDTQPKWFASSHIMLSDCIREDAGVMEIHQAKRLVVFTVGQCVSLHEIQWIFWVFPSVHSAWLSDQEIQWRFVFHVIGIVYVFVLRSIWVWHSTEIHSHAKEIVPPPNSSSWNFGFAHSWSLYYVDEINSLLTHFKSNHYIIMNAQIALVRLNHHGTWWCDIVDQWFIKIKRLYFDILFFCFMFCFLKNVGRTISSWTQIMKKKKR